MLSGAFGGDMSPSSESSDSGDDYLDGIRLTMPTSVESTPTSKHKGSSKTVTEAARRQLDDSYEEKETAAEVAARYREKESKKTSSNPATPIIPGKKQQQQQQHQQGAPHSGSRQSPQQSPSHMVSLQFEPNRPPARGHARRTVDEMSSSSSDNEPPRLALREPSPSRKATCVHSKPAEATEEQSKPPPTGNGKPPPTAQAESSCPPPEKSLQGCEITEEKRPADEDSGQEKDAALGGPQGGGGAAVQQRGPPTEAPKEDERVLLRMGQLLDRIEGLEKKVRDQDTLLKKQHEQIIDQLAISKASQVVQSSPKCCAVS